MSTTNYVTVTNNAIEESGADLATFDTGGADWTSNTNTLMNRMKRYVARAWRDIQQEAFDWGFLEEQAVININPGVMFYTDGSPVAPVAALTNTNVNILDQDGSTAISAIPFKHVTDLTGTSTDTKPFGYFDVTTTASTPITWSLKPGAEYFLSAGKFNYKISWAGPTYTTTITTATPFLADVIVGGVTYEQSAWVTTSTTNSALVFYSNNPDVVTAFGPVLNPSAVTVEVDFDAFSVAPSFTGGAFSAQLGTVAESTGVFPTQTNGTETIDQRGPFTVGNTSSKCYIHSWKSFNFSEETGIDDFQENIKEVDQKSFRTIDYFKAPATGEVPIEYVPWESFARLYDISSAPPGIPRIITRDNTNRFKLYPHPYYIFTLKFDYTRTPQDVSAYNDVFKGLDEDYIDIVMWKALIYYGEFDEQPSVVARATKNYKNFLTRLEQLYRQKFHFMPARLS